MVAPERTRASGAENAAPPEEVFSEFLVDLPAGDMDLQGWLIAEAGEEYPTYFVLVEKMPE